jgi:hypothetical protein
LYEARDSTIVLEVIVKNPHLQYSMCINTKNEKILSLLGNICVEIKVYFKISDIEIFTNLIKSSENFLALL